MQKQLHSSSSSNSNKFKELEVEQKGNEHFSNY